MIIPLRLFSPCTVLGVPFAALNLNHCLEISFSLIGTDLAMLGGATVSTAAESTLTLIFSDFSQFLIYVVDGVLNISGYCTDFLSSGGY